MRRALEGAEALFWCVPRAPVHDANVRAHYERFALAGYQAIRDVGTSRVVTISTAGSAFGGSAGRTSGLHAMEDILDRSGTSIKHLRCGWFMENFVQQVRSISRHGVFSYPLPGHVALPMTAAKDIADVALRFLERQDWSGTERIAVYGPEDISFNQSAATIASVWPHRCATGKSRPMTMFDKWFEPAPVCTMRAA